MCFVVAMLILQHISYSQSTQREDLASNNIKLSGWAKEYLVRQVSGLTGHPEESGFPFNTGMWTEDMDFRDREFPGGSEWWPYEQTALYLDGALRCGYMIESEELIRRAEENILYVIFSNSIHKVFLKITLFLKDREGPTPRPPAPIDGKKCKKSASLGEGFD